MKAVGIVGGLGPETTSQFYLDLIRKFRENSDTYPKIIIDNVSFPFYLEEEIIRKSINEEKILPFLKESIRRLNKAGADFIVIPCNTVHIFIDELRRESSVPILSIVDETVKSVEEREYEKVSILATAKTIESKLYQNPLDERKIKVVLPSSAEQEEVSRVIVKILENKISKEDKDCIENIISDLRRRGSESIILGCTDLSLIVGNSEISILDTTKILLESTFRKMI